MSGYKTYLFAGASAACALGAAWLGLITWDEAMKFIQTSVLAGTLRHAIK